MKTIKIRLIVVLWGVLVPLLAANCSDKKAVEKAEVETTTKTESVINVSAPPFKKFVVVTTEEAGLYKRADAKSPTLVRWDEADCESDFCEIKYQWSNQPNISGFELSTDIIAYEGRVFPVLGEEGKFYKVCTLNEWCDIESAYIPKASVGDIECAPVKPDMLEAEDNYFKCRVVKDGKYKDIVIIDEYDELNGEKLQVGVLKDGFVATPMAYYMDSYLDINQKEDIIVNKAEGDFFIRYNKSLAAAAEDGDEPRQLDPKKLNAKQIAKIVDTVTTKKPEYVNYMYHFPAKGLEFFEYKIK
ncbi:MAG: hypothetical protein IKX36_05815 [Prevotella sp.]|nr:hypothetical protein [Prevotella sp.]